MPLIPRALLGLLLVWVQAHPGHKAPEGHFHVLAAASGSSSASVELGACVGERGPAAPLEGGEPYDLNKKPISAEELEYFRLLGWEKDGKGILLRPGGLPSRSAEVEHLLAPFDAASERMDSETWSWLALGGHRLDEATCRLLGPNGKPVSRITVLGMATLADAQKQLMGVEQLRAAMKGLKPDEPLPARVLETLTALKTSAVRLPDGLEKAVLSAGTVSQALGHVESAHEQAIRFWDGGTTLTERLQAALPAVGFNAPARPTTYVNALERRLGDAFASDMTAVFSRYEPGRQLLDRFRKPDGTRELPHMLVLKLSQRPDDPGYGAADAVYHTSADAIVINHWSVAKEALSSAPEGDRARLSKEFADPAKLGAYLERHPEVRRSFMERLDTLLFHEMTHAWQNRRTRFSVEMTRGNVPDSNPIEKEHEAYRDQYRYFHAKLLADPAKAVDSPELASYAFLLSDVGRFNAQITDSYMRSFAGTSDVKTVRAINRDRRTVAEKLRQDGPKAWVEQGLRLLGLSLGDAAIDQLEADQSARSKEFSEKEWPKMRAEGYPALIGEYRRRGRLGEAFLLAYGSQGGVPEQRTAELRRELEASLASDQTDFNKRLAGWSALDTAGVELEPKAAARRDADLAAAARYFLDQARAERNPFKRREPLGWARHYALKMRGPERKKVREELELEESKK